jgi:hypothetical protein
MSFNDPTVMQLAAAIKEASKNVMRDLSFVVYAISNHYPDSMAIASAAYKRGKDTTFSPGDLNADLQLACETYWYGNQPLTLANLETIGRKINSTHTYLVVPCNYPVCLGYLMNPDSRVPPGCVAFKDVVELEKWFKMEHSSTAVTALASNLSQLQVSSGQLQQQQ